MRLVGGFGTLCDPLHTGVVEVFHFGEWGALCFGSSDDDQLVADVVCRQLGFPHGTPVDPREAQTEVSEYSFYGGLYDTPDESEGPQERFWLSAASCRGSEERLVDCDIRPGFRTANEGCTGTSVTRFQAACRQFAVSEALEDVTTPGAGLSRSQLVRTNARSHGVHTVYLHRLHVRMAFSLPGLQTTSSTPFQVLLNTLSTQYTKASAMRRCIQVCAAHSVHILPT